MTGSNPPFTTRNCRYGNAAIADAAALIRAGHTVAIPTETVYGLAADATDSAAVARIYEAKGRPSFNPLIVHVPDLATAQLYARFDEIALKLAAAFWPGPLTLVLPRAADSPIASLVTVEKLAGALGVLPSTLVTRGEVVHRANLVRGIELAAIAC